MKLKYLGVMICDPIALKYIRIEAKDIDEASNKMNDYVNKTKLKYKVFEIINLDTVEVEI